MKTKYLIYLGAVLLSLQSCKNHDGYFPKDIDTVKVEKIKLYKGYFTVNDSIAFSGTYFKKRPFDKSNILYGNLHIGDVILNSGDPELYLDIIDATTGDTTRYFVFTEL